MSLSVNAKRMLLVISALSLVIIAAGALYFRSGAALTFAVGALAACALNCLKTIMLERSVNKAVRMEQGAEKYMAGQYLLRFLLTGAVLLVAATQSFISLLGVAVGLFTLYFAALSLKLFIARDEKQAARIAAE